MKKAGLEEHSPRKAVEFLMNQMKQYAKRYISMCPAQLRRKKHSEVKIDPFDPSKSFIDSDVTDNDVDDKVILTLKISNIGIVININVSNTRHQHRYDPDIHNC